MRNTLCVATLSLTDALGSPSIPMLRHHSLDEAIRASFSLVK